MNLEKIKSLVGQKESHHLEFKKSTGALGAAFESVCAFLNSEGGTALIGITNEDDMIGQEITDKIKGLSQKLRIQGVNWHQTRSRSKFTSWKLNFPITNASFEECQFFEPSGGSGSYSAFYL